MRGPPVRRIFRIPTPSAYSVRVLGADGVGIATLARAFTQLAGVSVLDAERPRLPAHASVDNRHFLVRFAQQDCPAALQGVTRVKIGSATVGIHHHLNYQRLPCARCYSSRHTTEFCKVKPGQLEAARSRGFWSFSEPVKVFEVGQAATYCHTEVSSFEHFWASLVTVLAVPPDQAGAGQATLVGGWAASPENGPSQASVPTTPRSGTTRRPPDVTVDGTSRQPAV
ncbi:hypothetical protein PI124_g6989 [Phytophthora idaei]|nr:hypothetical protein PI125_g6650 [Phytophthora idaei]KAG3161542.1 hypothetical protein PI126_g6387 [Phytophthora idaei]KAG3248334.1 hypothetical protein PI124_g6989 [Phytophthora idaei]